MRDLSLVECQFISAGDTPPSNPPSSGTTGGGSSALTDAARRACQGAPNSTEVTVIIDTPDLEIFGFGVGSDTGVTGTFNCGDLNNPPKPEPKPGG